MPRRPLPIALIIALAAAVLGLLASAAAGQAPARPKARTPLILKTLPATVTAGATLRIYGRGLKARMLVTFRGPPGGGPLTARLVRRNGRWTVRVPRQARTGRISVRMPGGQRSAKFGPVQIAARAPVGSTVPVERPRTGASPFDGNVMWAWQLPNTERGNLDSIANRAKQAGINTIIFKASDGGSPFRNQFTPALVQGLQSRGLKVCGYSYVYGNNPTGEAAMGALIKRNGADCVVIDAEGEYEGKYASASTYITQLRAQIGDDFPVALAPFPYVDYHGAFPYSVFLGPGGAQYTLPQMYWKAIGTSVDEVFRRTYLYTRIYDRPIYPLGQLYESPPPADVVRFRQLAQAYGASGVSWWVWEQTSPASWSAISGAVPALTGTSFAPSQEWPALRRGAKGDPVIWVQQHLAGAGRPVAVNGTFDAATDAALRAFQGGAGLPASGGTDAATWQALLKVTPQPVNWTARARAGQATTAARSRAEFTGVPGH